MRSILEEDTAIDLQHINFKLLLEGDPDLDPVIPIFHNWIQTRALPELLIDVADYRHVHDGPVIVLIGHEADYSLDNTNGHLGLRYNRKAMLEGSNDEKLAHVARAALSATQRLQSDTPETAKLHFNGQDIDLFINDRLVAPNNDDTLRLLDSDLHRFAGHLLNGAEYSLRYEADPRRLFGVAIRSERVFSVDELIQNLNF